MFTFGRDHEKKCVSLYVRNKNQLPLAWAAIDSVHDLLDGKITADQMCQILREAFAEGGAGVWESAGYWFRKAAAVCPDEVKGSWLTLSRSPSANLRWRVACFLHEMPEEVLKVVAPGLVADKSRKVQEMAEARVKQRERKGEIQLYVQADRGTASSPDPTLPPRRLNMALDVTTETAE